LTLPLGVSVLTGVPASLTKQHVFKKKFNRALWNIINRCINEFYNIIVRCHLNQSRRNRDICKQKGESTILMTTIKQICPPRLFFGLCDLTLRGVRFPEGNRDRERATNNNSDAVMRRRGIKPRIELSRLLFSLARHGKNLSRGQAPRQRKKDYLSTICLFSYIAMTSCEVNSWH
jgi:hypothetical protein